MLNEYLANIADNESINKSSKLLQRSTKQKVEKLSIISRCLHYCDSKAVTIRPYAMKSIDSAAKVVTDGGTNLIKLREVFQS